MSGYDWNSFIEKIRNDNLINKFILAEEIDISEDHRLLLYSMVSTVVDVSHSDSANTISKVVLGDYRKKPVVYDIMLKAEEELSSECDSAIDLKCTIPNFIARYETTKDGGIDEKIIEYPSVSKQLEPITQGLCDGTFLLYLDSGKKKVPGHNIHYNFHYNNDVVRKVDDIVEFGTIMKKYLLPDLNSPHNRFT